MFWREPPCTSAQSPSDAEVEAFHAYLYANGIVPPTVFEYEALWNEWTRRRKPTPAENARRYTEEDGTW